MDSMPSYDIFKVLILFIVFVITYYLFTLQLRLESL